MSRPSSRAPIIGSAPRATRRPSASLAPPRIKASKAPTQIGRESSTRDRVEAPPASSPASALTAGWRRTISGARTTAAAGRPSATRCAARVTRASGRPSDAPAPTRRASLPPGGAEGCVGTFVWTGVSVRRDVRVTAVETTRASTGGAGALATGAEPASAMTTGAAATGSAWATEGAGGSDAGGDGSGAAGVGAGCSAAGGGAGTAAGEGAGAGGVAGAGGGWGALRDGSTSSGST